ncbi:MAG: PaaI family thioesterase [Rhodobacteraceae bacterium]|nr:PaaI family thioesterase [Paracoccaceae bacterium]
MTDLTERIQRSFDRQSLMATLGATLGSVAPGTVTISAPILAGARQQQGLAHAGLIFSIADSAAGYSALTQMPESSEVVTAELKINLLAPGAGDALIARGRVVKPGRRLVIVTAEVHAVSDGQETLIAIAQGTMVPVNASR